MQIRTLEKGRSHLRGVFLGDEVVAWLTIIDYRMRIGSANVRMGAIADVNTKQEYRMKGYMRALMEDSVQYMKDRGYDVSVVMAISDFYHRFEYVSCLPDHTLTIAARDAEEAKRECGEYGIRKFQKRDSEQMLGIYNENNRERTCSLIREKDYFSAFPKKSQRIFVVEDDNKNVAAYAVSAVSRRAKNKVTILEIGATAEDTFGALLAGFAKMAIKQRVGDIELFLPPDHPFAEYCKRYDCRFTTTYHKNGNALMRAIDQHSLFEKLEGEFNRRISRSHFRDYSGSLELRTDAGGGTLEIGNGSIKVYPNRKAETFIDLSQGQLAQLLAGYRSVRDVLNDTNVSASRGVEPLADALFPSDNPYIWDTSRFESLRMRPEEFYRGKRTDYAVQSARLADSSEAVTERR